MILVDTTVWIDYFNGIDNWQTDFLHTVLTQQDIIVGDIVLSEVLQGFRSDAEFEQARLFLSKARQLSLLTPDLAVQSARNYRHLRKLGITIRKTADCYIATFCIEMGHDLLHNDRDFDPFETHLGLQVIHP
jgi:predicted nucleic acid-binding protein